MNQILRAATETCAPGMSITAAIVAVVFIVAVAAMVIVFIKG